jgi:hypothetical protein
MRKSSAFQRACAVVLLCLFVLHQPGYSWGELGHYAINRAAFDKMPADVPPFFRAAGEKVVYNGYEPDRWRERHAEPTLNAAQAPDHFIDFERVDWMRELPQDRHEFVRRLYERRSSVALEKPDDLLPQHVGFQPYAAIEVYDRLKVAFREYRKLKAAGRSTAPAEANAIFYAGWLGHYVADGSNPMHTTIHHDRWVGANPKGFRTEKGLHWEFENDFVKRNEAKLKFDTLVTAPKKLEAPFADYVKYLRDSFAQLERLYEIEKAGGFKQNTPEAIEFTRQRLAAGSQMLANLWYTAWIESEKTPPRQQW